MTKGHPPSPVFVFWQTVLSVVLGIAAGLGLILYTSKPHAQALPNSLTISSLPSGVAGEIKAQRSTPALPVFPCLDRKLTLLVMGVDSNGQKAERWVATRSDSMLLVSLDPQSGKVGVVSIPRDSRVRIPGHGTDKINAAHALGGPALSVETVRDAFGVCVDHFVVVDTSGLRKFFEVIGPVAVLVENRMRYRDRAGHLNVDLQPGLQVLSPEQAEEYVRFRHDPRGDIGRIERQQWFVRQVARKLKEPQTLLKLPQLLALANEFVVTDLSIADMARAAAFLKQLDPGRIETATLPGCPATIGGCSYWLPEGEASRVVIERLIGPTAPVVASQAENSEAADVAFEQTVQPGFEPGSGEPVPAQEPYQTDPSRPLSVVVKYPRGSEEIARRLEASLESAGFRVAYRWQAPLSECQHEQVIQNSFRADDLKTSLLKTAVPAVANWPVVVALESRPAADFTLVVSQSSSIALGTAASAPASCHLHPALFE